MSSYENPEIQTVLPKMTEVKLIYYFFNNILTNNP